MFPYLQNILKNNKQWEIIDEDIFAQKLKDSLSSKPEHSWMNLKDREEVALNLCSKLLRSHLSFNSQNILEAHTYESGAFENYRKNYVELRQQYWEEGIYHVNDTFCLSQKYFNNQAIVERIQRRFKYIFMDEYQDVSPLAFDLLKMLFQNQLNIMQIIGDQNQHISYSNPEVNLAGFEKYYLNQINRFGDLIVNPLNKMFSSNRLHALNQNKSKKPILMIYQDATKISNEFFKIITSYNIFQLQDGQYILVFVRKHISDLSIKLLKTKKNSKESKFRRAKNLIYNRLSTKVQKRGPIIKMELQKNHPDLELELNRALLDFLKPSNKTNDLLTQTLNHILSTYNITEPITQTDRLIDNLSTLKSESINSDDTKTTPIINSKTVHDLKGQTLTSSLVYLQKSSINEKAFLSNYCSKINLEETELINKRVLYVAMSRATTLLIIALHRESYSELSEAELKNLKNDFDVIHI